MSIFFKKSNVEDKLICTLCEHYCQISTHKTGICGINKNVGDKIECLVYGYPAVINSDPVEKKPLYHFLPGTKTLSIGTVGCNFKCSFCQNHGISQEKNINKQRYYSPEDIVNLAHKNNCDSIAYTYNEPTIFYPYIKDIATLAKVNGLKNIFVSNGFESDEVIQDMVGLIDAVNIDYKSNDDRYYKQALGGNLKKLRSNLKKFKEAGIWLEITTLIIPKLNDSEEELFEIAKFIYEELGEFTPWHLSAFHPDYKMLDRGNTPIETLQRGFKIGKKIGLQYVYMGNARQNNTTKCPGCDEILMERITYKTVTDKRKFGILCPKCDRKIDGIFHTRRDSFFAGSFYSKSCSEITHQFNSYENILKNEYNNILHDIRNPRAIIVPHAGYIYSGLSAYIGYTSVKYINPKRVIMIGPSHKFAFEGISVSMQEKYQNVCGDIKIDVNYASALQNFFEAVTFLEYVHAEHSTETQAAFIKDTFSDSKLVELVYSKIKYEELANLIEYILSDKDNFLIVSTDLSHFHNLENANKIDNICLQAVENLDLNIWNNGCEACGRVGVKAMIHVAQKYNLRSKVLDYRTSYDVNQDSSRVVGYMSAVLGF